jgi:hypothetical protein
MLRFVAVPHFMLFIVSCDCKYVTVLHDLRISLDKSDFLIFSSVFSFLY